MPVVANMVAHLRAKNRQLESEVDALRRQVAQERARLPDTADAPAPTALDWLEACVRRWSMGWVVEPDATWLPRR